MDKNIKVNIGDQTVKGAILGAYTYFASKAGLDEKSIAMGMPIVLAAMAWVSTKIGDKATTAIFSAKK